MIKAASEKERLETKQRAVRKHKEKEKTEHLAAYFHIEHHDQDD